MATEGERRGDADDWTQAKSADTFDAYQAYLNSHPPGEHVVEARVAAAEVRPIANALKEEPAIGMLPFGVSKPVDDRDPTGCTTPERSRHAVGVSGAQVTHAGAGAGTAFSVISMGLTRRR